MKLTTLFLLFLNVAIFAQVKQNPTLTTNSIDNLLCIQKEIILSVSIKNSDYTYQWYKDNVAIATSNTPFHTIDQSGKYYVKITGKDIEAKSDEISINDCDTNSQKNVLVEDTKEPDLESRQKELFSNFNTNSKNYSINLAQGFPQLVATNPIICGTNTSTTLSVMNSDPSYTYTWLYSTSSSTNFSTIPSETNATYTTSTVGYYKVFISDGNGNITIGPLCVSNAPYGVISDAANNPFSTINTTVGQPVQLKFTLFGTGPWIINYNDGSSTKSVTASTSPFFLTISPTQNRSYYISYVSSNSCGSGFNGNTGLVKVVVDASTTINLTTPTNTTVCPGGTIEIPYTTVGTWTDERKIHLELINSSGTSSYNSSAYYASSPMVFPIPSSMLAGTYKIKAYMLLPSITLPVVSSYTINVSGAVCNPTAFITMSSTNVGCSNVQLYANPSSGDYSFQWLLNGNPISGATNYYYYALQTGNYSVVVSKSSTGYSSTSAAQLITIYPLQSKITSTNPSLCGSNTSATLNASPTGAGFVYQWYKQSSTGRTEPIEGATQESYTTNVSGQYYVNINNGICSSTSSNYYVGTGPIAIMSDMNDVKFNSINTTLGQPVQLKLSLFGGNSWTFTYMDGSNARVVATTISPYILTLTPEQNRRYSIMNVTSNCSNNSGYSTGNNTVIVDPTTAIGLTNPGSTTACAGGSIAIPYNTIGTWTSERSIALDLVDVNGNFISTYSYVPGFVTNPMIFPLPESLPIGTYKIRAYTSVPFVANSTLSSYTINVNSIGCSSTATFVVSNTNISCSSVYLTAYPYSSSNAYSYQWYLNGSLISNQTGRNLTATQTGNYSVRVTRASSGYDQTTSHQTITISGFTASITSANNVICGTNTTAILNASSGGAEATYQWFYSTSINSDMPINGATGQSYSATAIGYYRVLVRQNSSGCESFSSSLYVGSTPYGVLSDQSNNSNATVNISAGQTANLKITLYGQAPWVVKYYDGSQTRVVNVTSSPYTLQVSPNQNKLYYISSVSNICGDGYGSGNVIVNVDNSTAIMLNMPISTNICAGGSIEIPYTTIGTWTSERSIIIDLIDAAGNYVSGSSLSTAFTNPIRYRLPTSLILNGTYKVRIRPVVPYMSNYTVSTYTLTVTNTGCVSAALIYLSANNNTNSNSNNICGNALLYASPSINGSVYNWYKDGNLVYTSTDTPYYPATSSGNYSVSISNSSTGYNSTSLEYPFTINMESANFSGSPLLCDGGAAITLAGNISTGSYEWFYSPAGSGFSKVIGQSSSTLSTSNPGLYYFAVNNGSCQSISSTYRTCPILLNFSSTTVCQQSGLAITFNSYLYLSTTKYTLQLIDANTNAIVNSNLTSINGSTTSFYTLRFSLPSTVVAGVYKLRLVSDLPNYSSTSIGTLTVTSSVSSAAPSLTANPSVITLASQNITLMATGCNGTVVWSNNFQGSTQVVTIATTTTYTAYCTENNCNSALASVTVTLQCDPLEPNNSYTTPTLITSNSYQSIDVCLDTENDKDYFAWIHNGKVYYIMIRPFGGASLGAYKLLVNMSNGILTMETKPVVAGANLDTFLTLYDSNGTTQLGSDDDSGESNFSLLNYTLPTNPCPSSLDLYSSLFDVLSGQNTVPKAVQIIATNKLNNNSTANYRAENAIILNPGFETKYSSSGTFKAEIKGCNDN
jgi:hypothetical protein